VRDYEGITVSDELIKQVGDAVRRPGKRVWIGTYIDIEEGIFNVYVQVENENASSHTPTKKHKRRPLLIIEDG